MTENKQDIIVVGGGLAGLVSAILLNRQGLKVTLIEKKVYPFHRVCGEYISNEVKPFLEREGLFPFSYQPSHLNYFKLSDIKGNSCSIKLPLGGFGISRYKLDLFLYEKAVSEGVIVEAGEEVNSVAFQDDEFEVSLKGGVTLSSTFVVGAYGKRAKLDSTMKRSFLDKKSPFIGIKYHAYVAYPKNEIGLYNFKGGYCGVSHVEDNMVNICYLSKRSNLKEFGDIKNMEEQVLFKNPHLKYLLKNASLLREKPEVINEISFEKKSTIEDHMLMVGDTAGLITPLCGNGMAMAIHGAKIVSDLLIKYYAGDIKDRDQLELNYIKEWKSAFSYRLWIGRNTQNLFGNQLRSSLAVGLIDRFPKIGEKIIQQTHGEVF